MDTLSHKAGHNRRSICRIPLQLPIRLCIQDDSGIEYQGKSINLHHRGARITTSVKLSRGSAVRIGLPQAVTGRKTPPGTAGVIRWVSNSQNLYNYGISFKEDFRWVFTLSRDTLPLLHSSDRISDAESVLNSISHGVFSVNMKWQILSFNKAAEKLTGWKRDDVIGRNCQELFNTGSCDECILAESIRQDKPILNRSLFINTAQGKKILVIIDTTPLLDSNGKIRGGVQLFRQESHVENQKVPRITPVTIQTLGSFCMKINGQPLYDRLWKGRRSKELLKAIIVLGGTKVSLEKLSSLLWPDSDGDHALNNLKMALSRLRHIGGDECAIPSNWLVVKHHRVSLLRSVCRVDALEFGKKLESVSATENRQLLQQTLALYDSDFLPQDEAPWISPFRDHLRTLFIEGVLHLAALNTTEDDLILAFLEQARHSDPLHEGVYACLMEHYIEAGFPATALDIFHKAEKNISLRAGISPGAVLQSLANRAKQDNSSD